jgi:soluble cytochrome b562
MTDPKKVTVVFAPDCFDDFEGTQEELDELIAEIQKLADSGELEAISQAVEELDELDPEEQEIITSASESLYSTKKLH